MVVDLDKGHTRLLIEYGTRYGYLRNQLAYLLATSEWETAHTQEPVREAFWLSETWRRDNLRYYPHYGRGFVQLTWKDNYERADAELGLDGALIDNPDNALEPTTAARVIVQGMQEGWFTGRRIDEFITLYKSDFDNARKVVNGMDRSKEIAALAREYDAALRVIKYGVEEVPEAPVLTLEQRVTLLEQWADARGYEIPTVGRRGKPEENSS